MNKYTLLIMSSICSILITTFMFGNGLGLIVSLITLSLIITFLVSFKQANKLDMKKGLLIFIALILLSLSFVFRDQLLLHLLNICVFFALSVVYVVQMLREEPFVINSSLILKSLEQIFYPIGEFNTPFKLIFKREKDKKKKPLDPKVKSVLIGLLMAVPILMILTALLASADDVFSAFITIDTSLLDTFFSGTTLPKLFTWLFATVYVFSFFYYALSKEKEEAHFIEDKTVIQTVDPNNSKDITISTILILINILFVIFTFIQFKYLFSKGNIGFGGLTYSTYARKGFFELTVISMINLSMLLVFSKHTKNKINNTMMSLMIITTLVIAYSAIFRMNLYITAYGYTWLRLISLSFVVLQMVLLLITGYYLWSKQFNIITVLTSIYLIAYLTLNFVNVDYFIVEGNINRYLQGHELDTYYFESLSDDATDSLIKYYNEFKEKEEHQEAYKDIKSLLINNKTNIKTDVKWYNYNYSKAHAKMRLNQ